MKPFCVTTYLSTQGFKVLLPPSLVVKKFKRKIFIEFLKQKLKIIVLLKILYSVSLGIFAAWYILNVLSQC